MHFNALFYRCFLNKCILLRVSMRLLEDTCTILQVKEYLAFLKMH